MYCKLFASLYQGTLRGRSDEILVFTNLLAHTSAAGLVDKHFRAIAEETGLSVDRVKQAILILESPDEESRSPDEDGARLVRLDEHRVWGWRVVNHGKYRAIKNEDDRAEQNRLAQMRFRERKKAESNGGKSAIVSSVSSVSLGKPKQRHKAEAEAEAIIPPLPPKGEDEERKKPEMPKLPNTAEPKDCPESITLPAESAPAPLREAWAEWQAYRQSRAKAKGTQKLAWTEQAARMAAKQVLDYSASHGSRIVCDRIASAISGGWQGINLDKLEVPKQQPSGKSSILF